MVAEINMGSVVYDDVATGLASDQDPESGVFGDYMIHNHYERDGLTYAGSNTSPLPFNGAQVSVVTLGCPMLYWVCEWTACKLGGMPEIPDPTPQGGGWALLDQHVSPAMQSVGPSGNDGVFRVSGAYIYVKRIAADRIFDDVTFPRAPWVRDGAFSRKIPLDKLKQGFSDIPGGGGGSSLPPITGTASADDGPTQDDGQGFLGAKRLNQG